MIKVAPFETGLMPFLKVYIFEKYLGKMFFWGSKERLTRNIFRKYFTRRTTHLVD